MKQKKKKRRASIGTNSGIGSWNRLPRKKYCHLVMSISLARVGFHEQVMEGVVRLVDEVTALLRMDGGDWDKVVMVLEVLC